MKVICVDDEQPALDTFRLKAKGFPKIESLRLFSDCEEAIRYAGENRIDVAFLDIEMPDMGGIELARELKKKDCNIRIFFMTAFEQYALDAFSVKALGYIMKPYTKAEIGEALETAVLMHSRPKKRVEIETIPNFTVHVDGKRLALGGKKQELLALLVDRGETGLTTREAIACLWQDRCADEKTQTLYRVTFYQLMDELKKNGIEDIIGSGEKSKYIVKDMVECDLYRILDGETEGLKSYGGYYLNEYSWSETRNGQLNSMKEVTVFQKPGNEV
jgi:two-component system LytT family response regulator